MKATYRPIVQLKNFVLIMGVLALVQMACKILPGQAQPAADLPDLAIAGMSLQMQGQANGGCVDAYGPYEVEAVIVNQGTLPAGNIIVHANTGAEAWIETLAPGKMEAVRFPATSAEGKYTVQVDPQNLITESDESNNSYSFLVPTPTPPALCPTQPAPVPTADTPEAGTSSGLIAGLVYNNLDLAQTWSIGSDGKPIKLMDGMNVRISPDGSQAIYEADNDLWIMNLPEQTTRNLTNTPDRIEGSAQWWPANPTKIVFAVWYPNETRANSAGVLSLINIDGSGYELVGGGPSLSYPSLRSDGKTIAYDILGNPMLYEIGSRDHPFDPLSFSYNPQSRPEFTSPAWSPDGQSLLWWVVQPENVNSLLKFDLASNSYSTLHQATPVGGRQGWFPNPLWSPDGQWIAFQTRGETTPKDLTIIRVDGGQEYRQGIATDPVWSPDSQHLVYTQWPPRADSYLAASVSMIDVPSWSISTLDLPAGSIPSEWLSTNP